MDVAGQLRLRQGPQIRGRDKNLRTLRRFLWEVHSPGSQRPTAPSPVSFHFLTQAPGASMSLDSRTQPSSDTIWKEQSSRANVPLTAAKSGQGTVYYCSSARPGSVFTLLRSCLPHVHVHLPPTPQSNLSGTSTMHVVFFLMLHFVVFSIIQRDKAFQNRGKKLYNRDIEKKTEQTFAWSIIYTVYE